MKLNVVMLCAVFLLFGAINQSLAQNLQVTGKVINKSTGEALVGASVVARGTGVATKRMPMVVTALPFLKGQMLS